MNKTFQSPLCDIWWIFNNRTTEIIKGDKRCFLLNIISFDPTEK